jgi:hypothetical protein
MAKAKRIPKIKFNNLGNEQKKLMMVIGNGKLNQRHRGGIYKFK